MQDARYVGIGLLVALKNIAKYGGLALIPLSVIAALTFGLGLLWRGWFDKTDDAFIVAAFTIILGPLVLGGIIMGLRQLGEDATNRTRRRY